MGLGEVHYLETWLNESIYQKVIHSEFNRGVNDLFRAGMVHAGSWFAPEPPVCIL